MTQLERAALSLAVLVLLAPVAAPAQVLPGYGAGYSSPAPSLGDSMSGVPSGVIGHALPSVASAGTANTTGVLSYCLQHNYLSGSGAASVLSGLSGRGGVQSSSAFSAGRQGQLETGGGGMFSISGLKDQAKTRMCDMVLQHAKSML